MSTHQADYPIRLMCRLLGVSPSGYYAFHNRQPSNRARSDAVLSEQIATIHAFSKGTYGVPRLHDQLRDDGIRVGKKRVARLMRAAGLEGVSRRTGYGTTTQDKAASFAPDLVKRAFTAEAPDRLWVADITYIPTGSGFLYLAVVMDAFSRRIVGWHMAAHLTSPLVLAALDMALSQRKAPDVIHPSAESGNIIGNRQMGPRGTVKVVTDAGFDLRGVQDGLRFDDVFFRVHPRGFDPIQPGTFHGQKAEQDTHTSSRAFDGVVMGSDRRFDGTAAVPGGIIPDHHQDAFPLLTKTLGGPEEEVDGQGADRAAIDKPQPNRGRPVPLTWALEQQPVARQRLGGSIGGTRRLCPQPQRRVWRCPTGQAGLGKPRPPRLIFKAQYPVRVLTARGDQLVPSLFFRA